MAAKEFDGINGWSQTRQTRMRTMADGFTRHADLPVQSKPLTTPSPAKGGPAESKSCSQLNRSGFFSTMVFKRIWYGSRFTGLVEDRILKDNSRAADHGSSSESKRSIIDRTTAFNGFSEAGRWLSSARHSSVPKRAYSRAVFEIPESCLLLSYRWINTAW